MKPRLKFRFNVWSCRLPDFLKTGVIGHGYTPKEAYSDWQQRQIRCMSKQLRWSTVGY